jgi:predicted nucleic acid-binding Zn ribbon protein
MSATPDPSSSNEHGFLAPAPGDQPVDHCVRCGAATPLGVGLCDEHNPKALRGPSPTQMHATVFLGIVIGVIGLFVLFRLSQTDAGPFPTQVTATSAGAAGALSVAFEITNEGRASGHADCRFTRDGVPRPDDVAFRTPEMAAGETLSLSRELAPEADRPVAYLPDLLSVICQ